MCTLRLSIHHGRNLWPSFEIFNGDESWDLPLAELIETAIQKAEHSDLECTDVKQWFAVDEDYLEVKTDEEIIEEIISVDNDEGEENVLSEVTHATTVNSNNMLPAIETCTKWGKKCSNGKYFVFQKSKVDILIQIYKSNKQSKIDAFSLKEN